MGEKGGEEMKGKSQWLCYHERATSRKGATQDVILKNEGYVCAVRSLHHGVPDFRRQTCAQQQFAVFWLISEETGIDVLQEPWAPCAVHTGKDLESSVGTLDGRREYGGLRLKRCHAQGNCGGNRTHAHLPLR